MPDEIERIPSMICLYEGAQEANLHPAALAEYLGQWFSPSRTQIREEFARHHLRQGGQIDQSAADSLASDFANARIQDPARQIQSPPSPPDPQNLAQEVSWLLQGSADPEVFYDGMKIQQSYLRLINPNELSSDYLHIVITNRLLGTWDPSDRRYHARVAIFGLPCLISTTGLVEAPAKPREYYFGLMAGLEEEQLRAAMESRFVDYGDTRLTDLLKGYLMQALFYHLLAQPFCDDPNCRLFNAHWQEQMITAQLADGEEFCPRHRQLLGELSRRKGDI